VRRTRMPIDLAWWKGKAVQCLTVQQRGLLMDAAALVWESPESGYFCVSTSGKISWLEPEQIKAVLRCDDIDWRALCRGGQFFSDDDGRWSMPEIVPVAEKAAAIRANRSRAGIAGAAARWTK